jgi:hypothetical protein
MILVDTKVYPEHVQLIRSDIELESVKNCRDVGNESISKRK